MAKKRKIKNKPGMGNEALYHAMLEKRRSNAAGSHDNRPHRERSREAAKKAAIERDHQ